MKRSFLLALAALLLAAPAHAYFELTDAGARVIALGPSAMATVDDASAYHWNPAALVSLRRPELLIDYSKPYGVDNLNENTLAVAGTVHGFGTALAWHHVGVTDAYGEEQFCVAAARTLQDNRLGRWDAGATFKFGRAAFQPFDVAGGSHVDYGAISRGSLDLGLRWRSPWSIDLNYVVRDVLEPRYEFIPGSGGGHLTARQDVAAAFKWNRESTITLGWSQVAPQATSLSAGMEILFFNVFAIRTGLRNLANVYEAQRSPNDLQFSGGLGVFHKGYHVDAAAQTSRDLGASYRMSLRFPFGHGGRP